MTQPQGDIAILTDSSCDLPQQYFKKYPIFRLPLIVTCGETAYRDGVDITADEVYRRQPDEDFKTSLPLREDVNATFDAIARAGYRQVVVLPLPSALSSTTNQLRLIAAERTDLEITVFDTRRCASAGLGMLAVQAAQYAVSGMAFVRLKEVVARLIEDTTVFFCIDTLEYLRRGGRIGRVTAVAGSLLQIKPILTIGSDGVIGTAAKVRGRSAAFAKLLDLVEAVRQEAPPAPAFNLVVCDGAWPEEGRRLEEQLKKRVPGFHQLLHGSIDATLAVHLGPHLLGAGIQFLPTTPPPV